IWRSWMPKEGPAAPAPWVGMRAHAPGRDDRGDRIHRPAVLAGSPALCPATRRVAMTPARAHVRATKFPCCNSLATETVPSRGLPGSAASNEEDSPGVLEPLASVLPGTAAGTGDAVERCAVRGVVPGHRAAAARRPSPRGIGRRALLRDHAL